MAGRKGRLLVAAGGSGGHIFPGLTIAQRLMTSGWEVHWIGSANGMERKLVPRHGIEISFAGTSSVRGGLLGIRPLKLLRNLWELSRACQVVRSWKPDVALGMGGCTSIPGVVAAWSYRVPVVLHEQNAVAGISNRWLSHIASRSLQAYPGTLPLARMVGNPVRDSVLSLPSSRDRLLGRSGPVRILVMGGSRGSQALNRVVPVVADSMSGSAIFLHQTGKSSPGSCLTCKVWGYQATEFIDDVASAYFWADLVICRSGALTVSEIVAARLPAIFVPFRHADRHQEENALPLVRSGAAVLIRQSELTVGGLVALLRSLGRRKLVEMAGSYPRVDKSDVTGCVAEEIESLAEQSPWRCR